MPDRTMALPPGFVFRPLDEHLLDFYLRKKILGETLPRGIIVEADVYGDDPKNLTARYNMENRDSEWFFFASRTRRHPGAEDSKRVSRSAGLGRWKATQGIKTVLDSKRKVLGSKQCFCYMERSLSGGEKKSIWLMEEYSIHGLPTKDSNKLGESLI